MTTELDEVMQHMPPEIGQAIQRFGFHKLAARVHGQDDLDAPASARIIGEKFAARLSERRLVLQGLSAFAALMG
jgi:hypothetical protein